MRYSENFQGLFSCQTQEKIKARKFMSNLTEGILYWLGIDTKQVSNPRDLFSGEDQKDERNELEKLSGRRLDPYIDIRGK